MNDISAPPWKAVIEHEMLDGMRQDLCPRVLDALGNCICELWSSTQTITPFSQSEQEANAILIAKAPEMRDGLRDLIEQVEAYNVLHPEAGEPIYIEPAIYLLQDMDKMESVYVGEAE